MPVNWTTTNYSMQRLDQQSISAWNNWNITTSSTTSGYWVSNPWEPVASVPIARRQEQGQTSEQSARDRARVTLLSLLSSEEQHRYRIGEGIKVRGSAGGEYLIRSYTHQQNIFRTITDESGVQHQDRLCAHPRMWINEGGNLPVEDALIAQLLMLRFDEPRFLQIANIERLT